MIRVRVVVLLQLVLEYIVFSTVILAEMIFGICNGYAENWIGLASPLVFKEIA